MAKILDFQQNRVKKSVVELDQLTGVEFLKQMVIESEGIKKSPEYEIFFNAIKALKDSTNCENVELEFSAKVNQLTNSLVFNFKFNKA